VRFWQLLLIFIILVLVAGESGALAAAGSDNRGASQVSQLEPRLASPEGAFNAFKEALRTGSIADLKASTTPYFWGIWGEAFQHLTPQDLYQMGLRLENIFISKQEIFEIYAILHLQTRTGEQKRNMNLEKISGNWRIDGM
jgi:hypothetical protein